MPYKKNGWKTELVDIQNGVNFFSYDWNKVIKKYKPKKIGVIFMIPCDDYALCGAKHFALKDANGQTYRSQQLVNRCHEMLIDLKKTKKLLFWMVENPKSRIHKLNPWLGTPTQKLNPCDVAGYGPINRDSDNYNKETWLFGEFNPIPLKKRPPKNKESPIHIKFGGKSLRTKNARSITPLPLSYGFYEANH